MSDSVHIASLLIHAFPDKCAAVENSILGIEGSEIAHTNEDGRLIVTLETNSEANIVQTLTDIQLLTGVVSASLVYHQTDGEPEAAPAGI
jgi:periplasmic nitrate reductase NapD